MSIEKNNNSEIRVVHNWIDGKLCKSNSDHYGSVTDSATGEQCASVVMSLEEDVKLAIKSSVVAFPSVARSLIAANAEKTPAFTVLTCLPVEQLISLCPYHLVKSSHPHDVNLLVEVEGIEPSSNNVANITTNDQL